MTLKPRNLRSKPRDEAVIPLPNEDTTPPVTKMNLTFFRDDILLFFALKYRLTDEDFQSDYAQNENFYFIFRITIVISSCCGALPIKLLTSSTNLFCISVAEREL